jgi:hypothetical protein
MDTNAQRTMTPVQNHPRRNQPLSLVQLNVLARKISRVDAVTFAMAHEQIENFMGGVNLATPGSSIHRTNNGASTGSTVSLP